MAKPFMLQVAEWAIQQPDGVTKEQVAAHFGVPLYKAKRAVENICYTSFRYDAIRKAGALVVRHIRYRDELGTATNMVAWEGAPVEGSKLPPVHFKSGREAAAAGFPASCVTRAAMLGKPYAGYYWSKA